MYLSTSWPLPSWKTSVLKHPAFLFFFIPLSYLSEPISHFLNFVCYNRPSICFYRRCMQNRWFQVLHYANQVQSGPLSAHTWHSNVLNISRINFGTIERQQFNPEITEISFVRLSANAIPGNETNWYERTHILSKMGRFLLFSGPVWRGVTVFWIWWRVRKWNRFGSWTWFGRISLFCIQYWCF